ncbi:SOS response-associated peptidase [Roseinatronobacter bogoriensis]|uniref:Abasic site processing protein n=1 Tax=Roseinatronobacter bogoriensis subsp. barguzinensis TaxID=441209 RepID=A0A2K8KBD1_9RHOB|nr:MULTISPECIES: SOS response-associated peptidase [Rhodobaca]ATX65213.1 SOS response-associated peptidase [Rhodobaca barguzinensis]MBB4209308.1 putative SOS response-associated peptidase YedK [Rhodobaca bogoriensis DSM 18756]
MCGRFAITLPDAAMARAFQAQPANDLPPVPRFNICPTQPVATVVSRDGARHLGPMRWGFLPHWYKTETDGPLLINARAETIANKPAFADAARTRRCLIPATGFYEWTKGADGARLPWYIRPAQGDLLAFAGIWQVWEQGDRRLVTCAIVTCAANSQMAKLHHRMPVILSQADWPLWLGEAGHGAATLMRAAPDDTLEAHRVSPAVNSNRAEGAELIEPLDAER